MSIKKKKKKNKSGVRPTRSPIGKRHAALLDALCHSTKEQQRALLRGADESFVKCIGECALNVLQGIVQLEPSVKDRLRKYKNVLRQLAECSKARKQQQQRGGGGGGGGGTERTGGAAERKRRKYNWRAKKRLMMQKGCGAFLPLLLAPIITNLFSRLFGGNDNGSSKD